MRLLSFFDSIKTPKVGVAADDGVIDLSGRTGVEDIRRFLTPAGIEAARAAVAGASPDFGLDEIVHAPVVPNPERIICVGLNYATHAAETARSAGDYPVLFTRFASAHTGHRCPLVKPAASDKFDFEGELAVVIGEPGHHIPEARAMEHVVGYSCYNDGSVRDWQRRASQFTPGKNFPHSGAFGPWLVTADEIADPAALRLTTRLNGAVVQDSKVELIFTIPRLIAYISTFTPLSTGDVIVTGTPSGVGEARTPQLFMFAGDEISVEIEGIGTLTNPVIDESQWVPDF